MTTLTQDSLLAFDGGCSGRTVLTGAFAVLDAIASTDAGLGLTALARESGLAKSSAYRLAEQLVVLGAVQRVEQRYYVGSRIARLGRQWHPDPALRRAAIVAIQRLSAHSRAWANLTVLRNHRLEVIYAAAPPGCRTIPHPTEHDVVARSAAGRVLYVSQSPSGAALPDCWTAREWQAMRSRIADQRATVTDNQDAVAGINCVSAPVWSPKRRCAGAVTIIIESAKAANGLADAVVNAARQVGQQLQAIERHS